MQGVMKKAGTVVLAAVLAFMVIVPFPSGNKAFDELRYERAHAAIPVVVVLGTAVAAGGLLIGGASVAAYNGNLQTVYNGFSQATQYWSSSWSQYVQDKGSFDAALNSAVTVDGQSINLQTLTDAGFFDSLQSYAVYMVDEGLAAEGESSLIQGENVYSIDGNIWRMRDLPNWANTTAFQEQINVLKGQGYEYPVVFLDGTSSHWVGMSRTTSVNVQYSNAMLIIPSGIRFVQSSKIYGNMWSTAKAADNEYAGSFSVGKDSANNDTFFCRGVDLVLNGDAMSQTVDTGGVMASVLAGLYDGTAIAPTSTVQPFEPTAEQLETGYTTADILEAVQAIGGDIAGVVAQISGLATLLHPLAGIAANVQNIRDWWNTAQAQVFGQTLTGVNALVSWAGQTPFATVIQPLISAAQTVASWVGSTPFGTVMGTVIDGVQAIPDGIRNAGAAVGTAVNTGVGVLEGVLEGVLSGVQSIPLSISQVVSAIQAGVLDLTGALDVAYEQTPMETSGDGLRLRDELKAQLDAQLDMKAPFCYMRRMQVLASSVSGNFGGNPSFYFDVAIPYAGVQRFDAGSILNQTWGSRSVADYIRIMLTATMCAGLLAVSLKLAIGRIGSKEE